MKEFLVTFYFKDGRARYCNFYAEKVGELLMRSSSFYGLDISWADQKLVSNICISQVIQLENGERIETQLVNFSENVIFGAE